MRNKRCKAEGCNSRVASGKSLISWAARTLGYCRYCYLGEFPEREKSEMTIITEFLTRPLSRVERLIQEAKGFNMSVWSDEFRKEYLDYIEAVKRGEI